MIKTDKNNLEVKRSEEEWKEYLDPEAYRVLREKGTEVPNTGVYVDSHEAGTYVCKGCGNKLFSSGNKFDSGCGWPSFDDVVSGEGIITDMDMSHGMTRVEVMCGKCGGHLGHVFPDGPKDTTGLRYCINSVALNFEAAPKDEKN